MRLTAPSQSRWRRGASATHHQRLCRVCARCDTDVACWRTGIDGRRSRHRANAYPRLGDARSRDAEA